MGSLVIKIDAPTEQLLKNRHHYSDIDILNLRSTKHQDVPMVYDADAVRLAIRNILTWRVGESILRPEFGHKVHQSMYEQVNQFNREKICNEIQRAIEENEPRVIVKSVSVKQSDDKDDNGNALNVRVAYSIKGDKSSEVEFQEQTTISGK